MVNLSLRVEFANFLDEVAKGTASSEEWQQFVVEHYADAVLEEIRRKLVRLSMGREGIKNWSDSELATLHQWSRELRDL